MIDFLYILWFFSIYVGMLAFLIKKGGKVENKKINGYTINFLEVDCEKEEGEANKYNIEGYPTIKLVYKDKVITYDE